MDVNSSPTVSPKKRSTEMSPLLRRCDNLEKLYAVEGSIRVMDTETRPIRWGLGISYAICVGTFTLIEVVLFMNVKQLISNVEDGLDADDVDDTNEVYSVLKWNLYAIFSAAAILGTIVSPFMYCHVGLQSLLLTALLGCSLTLIAIDQTKHMLWLYVMTGLVGAFVGLGNTVCVAATRKLHRHHAGFWISLNSISFTVFNASASAVEYLFRTSFSQFVFVSAIIFLVISGICLTPNFIETAKREMIATSTSSSVNEYQHKEAFGNSFHSRDGYFEFLCCFRLEDRIPHFRIEFVGSIIMVLLIGNELLLGGNCQTTNFLGEYIDKTSVIPSSESQLLAVGYFLSILSSRVYGAYYQMNASTSDLMLKTVLLLLATLFVAILLYLFGHTNYVLIVGILLIGILYGTIPPFVMQIINNSTFPTMMSVSLVMCGVNLGVLVMPELVTVLWDKTQIGDNAIFVLLAVCHAVCIPLLMSFKYLRYCFQD